MSEYSLDARRLLCPLPVIRLQTRIGELSPGDNIRIHCTDPGVLSDIPAWCNVHGHDVVETHEDKGEISLLIQIN